MVTENGTALFESDAIIEYIEEEYDSLEKTSVTNNEHLIEHGVIWAQKTVSEDFYHVSVRKNAYYLEF